MWTKYVITIEHNEILVKLISKLFDGVQDRQELQIFIFNCLCEEKRGGGSGLFS